LNQTCCQSHATCQSFIHLSTFSLSPIPSFLLLTLHSEFHPLQFSCRCTHILVAQYPQTMVDTAVFQDECPLPAFGALAAFLVFVWAA
jgi:hypothetical protein